ncbi:MAG: trypsin-like peptidase domain-containing protein [Bacteroidota bacterium]
MRPSITYTIAIILITAFFSTSISFCLFKAYATDFLVEQEQIRTAQFTSKVNEAPTPSIPQDFVATSKIVTKSVVNITVYRGDYRISAGSGIIISSNGYIVTNNHVIEGSTFQEVTLSDKREVRARVIGRDASTDIALLKIDVENLQPIRLGNSDHLQIGEWVLAVGNPFNLASTVTAGIVSAKARNIQILRDQEYAIESFIQTDAVVNPGNSGGALVNAKGELIGVNTAIISESGGYEGFSFAIPSNLVAKVTNDLKEYGKVKRAVLGVVIGDVNSSLAKDLNLDKIEGVLVQKVNPNTTAFTAGIRPGDVITGINGLKVKTTPELQEQMARYRPGDIISIDYIREGVPYRKNNIELKAIQVSQSPYSH